MYKPRRFDNPFNRHLWNTFGISWLEIAVGWRRGCKTKRKRREAITHIGFCITSLINSSRQEIEGSYNYNYFLKAIQLYYTIYLLNIVKNGRLQHFSYGLEVTII